MKHLAFFLAATIGVGGLTTGVAADKVVEKTVDHKYAPGDRPADLQPLALPQGIVAKDLKEDGDIRNAFKALTEATLNNDTFDNVVDRLVDADRDRIKKFKDTKPDWKPLHDKISGFSAAFKTKYGKGATAKLDERVVFGGNGIVLAQGEVADPNAVIGHWPVAPVPASAAQPAAAKVAPADTAQQAHDAHKLFGGNVNLEKGRDVALARFPASHGLSALDASLIHEKPDIWRFDIPDTVDGRKLYDNLVHHIDMMGDPKTWPDDVNEGYRMLAHHVLMAIYDVNDMPKATH
jgi:hypothetical protein